MRVTSALGTDLTVDLRGAPCGGTAGFGTTPGSVAHWPGGLCLAFPGKGAVNGRIVMGVGDMNLTFKTCLTSGIDFTIEDDFVTAIKGDGIDALHLREYMEAWDDRNAYGMSHVGWGMNPGARWVSAAMYDKRDMQAVEFRALAGSFLWSTGRQPICRALHAGPFRPADAQLHHRAGSASASSSRTGVLQGRAFLDAVF